MKQTKKLVLMFLCMMAMTSVSAQTASKIIEKYKTFEGAEYSNNTADAIQELKDDFSNGSFPDMTQAELDKFIKGYKVMEQVQLDELDAEQLAELDKDISKLKGYELLMDYTKNKEPESTGHLFQDLIRNMFPSNQKVIAYAKFKNDKLYDFFVRVNLLGKLVLGHSAFDGIPYEILAKTFSDNELMKVETSYGDDALDKKEYVDIEGRTVGFDELNEGLVVEMSDIMDDVKSGNVLYVINGVEHPEIRSAKEVTEWEAKNNWHHNHETWVVGPVVKEKYPKTEKKVVIEFSRDEK